MNTYQINCYDHNGQQRNATLTAKNLRGAKIKAYRYASGTTNRVTVDGPDGYAERKSVDSFAGFCQGAKDWE